MTRARTQFVGNPERRGSTLLFSGLLLLLLLATLFAPSAGAREVVIGVLAHRGTEEALARWQPTAGYLNSMIPEHTFVIRPLDLDGLRWATANQELDFILTNPGNYVELESDYGATRLLTLRNRFGDQPYTVFGAVIFTRSDRDDITSLRDLEGKSFMAVSRDAFGGFQIAWRELKLNGIDPFKDFSRLEFAGFPQDQIVMAVKEGRVDGATVRTNILERMSAEGKIRLGDFRILAPRITSGFPFGHSTRLYPEWPLARSAQTSDDLAQQVAVVLLTMPQDHPAAVAGRYAGWTVPLDYHLVHELLVELGLGPYQVQPTLEDLLAAYAEWIAAGLALLLLLSGTTAYVLHLNQRLKQSKYVLEMEVRERMRAERGLLHLSSALEQSADIVMITDVDGVIEYVNAAFEEVTGYDREEAVNSPARILKSGYHDQEFYERLWSTILEGRVFKEVMINRRKDGSLYYEEKTITPLKTEDGRVLSFVSTGRDITRRIEAEERARQREAQLAHVSRISLMGEMASSLAHELNQPLAAIVNYANGCLRRLEQPEIDRDALRQALESISTQGERSGQIIHRLRNFMRRGEPQRTSVTVRQVVAEACELAALEAKNKRITIKQELVDTWDQVSGDPIQLEQVILNLIHNAMEAIHGCENCPRVVLIRSFIQEGRISVEVIDTGPGLPEKDMEHVFEAFYTTKSDGMGMGLSISRSIIEALGGSMYIRPNLPQGARFGFSLPLERPEAPASESVTKREEKSLP